MDRHLGELVILSRELGDESRDWVILGEGNVSSRLDDDSMYVKATGRRMAAADPADFVVVPFGPLLTLLDDVDANDATVAGVFERLSTDGATPSIESLLHVVCQTVGGATVVAHTHPTDVNVLLCSEQADALVKGSIFPDQVVVLGPHQLLVPYADPGLVLARIVRSSLTAHIEHFGEPPKVIYLRNHGMFALGSSAPEVLSITAMANKTAKILRGALSIGTVVYLPPADVHRLHVREDEVRRRGDLLRNRNVRLPASDNSG